MSPPRIGGLRSLIFPVADLDAAKGWYTSLLGRAPYFDQPFYVGFDCDGYELGLLPADEAAHQQPGLAGCASYLAVDDPDAACERAIALGATALDPPRDVGGEIRLGSVADPFGNRLGFIRNPDFAPPLVAPHARDDLAPTNIVREATLPLPRGQVWPLWTSSEGLASWLVPDSAIELIPGGRYEWFFMPDNPWGSRGGEGNRVLAFLPERMLSFSWNAPPHLARVRPQHTWVVVAFADEGEGTKVTLEHLGWPEQAGNDEPQWAECIAYFENAWTQVMEALARKGRRGE